MADDRSDAENEIEDEANATDEAVLDAELAAEADDDDEVLDAVVEDDLDDDPASDDAASDDPATEGTASAPKPAPTVVHRKVVSKRVTPKGGGPARSSGPATRATIAAAEARSASRKGKHDDLDEDITFNDRYVSPNAKASLPSPWWVPALMFGLIIVGGLIIMLNYMGTFGDPENIRLIIGLVFILGGIIAATQYR